MSADGTDANPFIHIGGDLGVVSRAALQLHGFAIINSIRDGHPGFVHDDYLNAISADTTTAVAELEAAGAWVRRDGGYFIVADEMVEVAIAANERMARSAAECQARSAHVPDPDAAGGWVTCDHCGVPLRRPDGGPVALPDGGPLGPDPRDG